MWLYYYRYDNTYIVFPGNLFALNILSTLPWRLNNIIFALNYNMHNTNNTCVYISAHLLSQLGMAEGGCESKKRSYDVALKLKVVEEAEKTITEEQKIMISWRQTVLCNSFLNTLFFGCFNCWRDHEVKNKWAWLDLVSLKLIVFALEFFSPDLYSQYFSIWN